MQTQLARNYLLGAIGFGAIQLHFKQKHKGGGIPRCQPGTVAGPPRSLSGHGLRGTEAQPHCSSFATLQRVRVPANRQAHASMTESQTTEVLEIELHRLENSCQHLQRSNQELQQAMDLDGPDPDFRQAVQVVRSIQAY